MVFKIFVKGLQMDTLDHHTAKTYLENLYQDFRRRLSIRKSIEIAPAFPVADGSAQPSPHAEASASGDSGPLLSIHIG